MEHLLALRLTRKTDVQYGRILCEGCIPVEHVWFKIGIFQN